MIPTMTTPDSPVKETRDIDVKGRVIVVKQLMDAQLLLLAREARLAQNPDTEQGRRLAAVGRIFDILESAIIEDKDQEYILDLTTKGKLELKDLTDFISAFETEDEGEQPKVRRGRPPAKRTQ